MQLDFVPAAFCCSCGEAPPAARLSNRLACAAAPREPVYIAKIDTRKRCRSQPAQLTWRSSRPWTVDAGDERSRRRSSGGGSAYAHTEAPHLPAVVVGYRRGTKHEEQGLEHLLHPGASRMR